MAGKHLTPDQIRQFHEEGFLVAENVLDNRDLQPVIDEINGAVAARARELVATGKLTRTYEEFGFEHQLTMISAENGQLALSLWEGKLTVWHFNLIRNPKLLDVAESLCGSELIASSVYRLRPKVRNHRNAPVPWHQDSGYFEAYCDKALVLTVWIPLVDATEERGCLWVIPRAHKNNIFRHIRPKFAPYLEIQKEHLPDGQPLCVPVKKGGILLLTNMTPHASFENSTDIVRWSTDLRYQNAALPTNAKITRLSGEDTPSADNQMPIACFPPEADFLVRSKLRPHEVLASPDEFQEMNRTHLAVPLTDRWKQ